MSEIPLMSGLKYETKTQHEQYKIEVSSFGIFGFVMSTNHAII